MAIVIKYRSLPCIKELTPRLVTVLRQDTSIKIANRTLKKVGNLHTKLKEPIDKWEASSIKVRPSACALPMRATSKKHNINFDNTIILAKEKNTFIRKFIEMTYINQ